MLAQGRLVHELPHAVKRTAHHSGCRTRLRERLAGAGCRSCIRSSRSREGMPQRQRRRRKVVAPPVPLWCLFRVRGELLARLGVVLLCPVRRL